MRHDSETMRRAYRVVAKMSIESITPINQPPVLQENNALTVQEGSVANIVSAASLLVTDPDDGPADLTYTVTAIPVGGTLKLSGVALVANDTFTQADINANGVTYDQTTPGATSDFFTFSCADGGEDGAQPVTGTFSLVVQAGAPLNQPPFLVANSGLTVAENATGTVIGTTQLRVNDPDDGPAELTYTITSNVGSGTLRLSGVALIANDTFTQADVDANNLTYDQESTLPFGPFNVTNGGDNLLFQDDNNDILNAVPSSVGTNALWSVYRTNNFAGSGALPGLACDVVNASGANPGSYRMKKISLQYHTASNELRLQDFSLEEGNPQLQIAITNVIKPAVVDASTQPNEFKITSNSVFEYAQSFTLEMSINPALSASSDSFEFSCADGGEDGAQPVTGTFTITIQTAAPVNQPPVLVDNNPLIVAEYSTGSTIPVGNLRVTDPDDGPSELTYSITRHPRMGHLRKSGDALAVGQTFTQTNINSNLIQYDNYATQRAYRFDGVNDRVETTAIPATSGSLFIRFERLGSGTNEVFVGSMNAASGRLYIGVNASGNFGGAVGDDSYVVIEGPALTQGWHTGCLTWNGSNVFLYLDGSQVFTKVQAGAPTATQAIDLGSLNVNGASANFADCQIADVELFDRALTAAEVTYLDSFGASGTDPGPTNTIAHWPCRDIDPVNAFDIGGNDLNGVKTNVNPITFHNAVLRGLEFDGVDDHVDIPGLSQFAFVQNSLQFTLSFWLKLDDPNGRYAILGSSVASANKGFAVSFENGVGFGTQAIRFFAYSGSGQTVISGRTPDNVITDTDWHHVTVRSSGSGDNLLFTIDGVEQTTTYSTNFVALATGDSTLTLNLGRGNHATNVVPLNGVLSDVRIYSSELSTLDTINLGSRVPISATPVAHWPLTIDGRDIGNNAYDGTVNGATVYTDPAMPGPLHDDVFNFSCADGGENGSQPATGTFTIQLTSPGGVTNQPPVLFANQSLTVAEASTANVIPTANLNVIDPDDGPAELTYTLTAIPVGGVLKLSAVALAVNDTFTQAQVNAGNLTYDQTSPGSTNDFFTFSCADGGEDGAQPVTGTFSIVVQPSGLNQQPVLQTNQPLTLNQGASNAEIPQSKLEVTDPDDGPLELTYTLTAIPTKGNLLRNQVVLAVNDTFTQADINAGTVTYTQTLPDETSDSFSFSCADGGEDGTVPVTGTFQIAIIQVPSTPTQPPFSLSGNNRGMNIGTVSDFDNYLVFGDAIRQAVWIPGPDTNSQFRKSFNKDESSCPQIPGSQGLVYLRGSAGDQYTLRIRSTANYANPGTASVTILGQTYTADAIITLAADTVSAGMVINSSDNTLSTWNTVVELWHPGQVGNKFHTDYIAPLLDTDGNGGNTGIIRFLNWLPINRQRGNQQPVIVTPDDMIEPDRPCQANTQFRSSPELMFEFADACNADVWFNIPHTANDALIAHLAGLALAWKTANPQKRVYVEFSNEMWNTGTFGQAIDARDWGKIEWPQIAGETPSQWNVRAMASWYGKYAARAFNVFDQTYTGQPYELVLAWQAASNSTPVFVYDEFILERDGNVPPDCWAIAPYSDIRIPTQKTFVNAYEQQVVPGAVDQDDVIMAGQTAAVDALLAADWTPATMLNLMNTATNDGIAQSTKYIQNHFAFASPRGMRLVCYEGGEHLLPRIQYAEYELSGFPRAVTYPQFCDNFVATSYLAGMQDHLEALDAVWVAEGGQECVWLVYVQEPRDDSHASFGFRRDMYDDLSPKWRAWQTIVEDDILRAAGLWGT